MPQENTQDLVTRFIYSKFPLARKKGISETESLLESGIVDSMGILEIVTFIEDQFSIQLSDEEVLADNFATIQSIAELIDARTKQNQ